MDSENIWANDPFNSGTTDDFHDYNSRDEQSPWGFDEFGPDADAWDDLSAEKDANEWVDMFVKGEENA